MSTQNHNCPFCAIARKDSAAHVIFDRDEVMAFLDIRPIRPGHAQIIPKAHADAIEDVPPEVLSEMMRLAQALVRVMKAVYGVPRVAVVFTGGDIAHAHMHVVPLQEATDITSRQYIAEERITFRPAPDAPYTELLAEALKLRQGLAGSRSDSGME